MKTANQNLRELLEQESQGMVSHEEVEAVARMISVLKTTDKPLPADFSDKVVRRVIEKQRKANRLGWFWYVLGIAGLIICLIVSLAFVEFKPDFGFLRNISGYSGLFIFGAVFIFLLNLLEKKVIRFSSE